MSDLLDALNDEQRLAVENFEGYVRLHAGAGTGKTRTLTYRYAYLVSVLGIPPKSVWCCTFTNKAASEMKERIVSLCGDVGEPFVSTFHSFCVSFLKEEIIAVGWPKNFTIWDVNSVKSVLRPIYEECGIDGREFPIRKAWNYIDTFKEEQSYIPDIIDADTAQLLVRSDMSKEFGPKIFWRYLFAQRTSYALDFDDLILFTLHILRHYPEIRARWQERLEFIMVDEFQDIDRDQYELVEILAGKHHNLFIVGDPDQTIYSWRGARVNYFNDFILRHGGNPQVIDPLETEAVVRAMEQESAKFERPSFNTDPYALPADNSYAPREPLREHLDPRRVEALPQDAQPKNSFAAFAQSSKSNLPDPRYERDEPSRYSGRYESQGAGHEGAYTPELSQRTQFNPRAQGVYGAQGSQYARDAQDAHESMQRSALKEPRQYRSLGDYLNQGNAFAQDGPAGQMPFGNRAFADQSRGYGYDDPRSSHPRHPQERDETLRPNYYEHEAQARRGQGGALYDRARDTSLDFDPHSTYDRERGAYPSARPWDRERLGRQGDRPDLGYERQPHVGFQAAIRARSERQEDWGQPRQGENYPPRHLGYEHQEGSYRGEVQPNYAASEHSAPYYGHPQERYQQGASYERGLGEHERYSRHSSQSERASYQYDSRLDSYERGETRARAAYADPRRTEFGQSDPRQSQTESSLRQGGRPYPEGVRGGSHGMGFNSFAQTKREDKGFVAPQYYDARLAHLNKQEPSPQETIGQAQRLDRAQESSHDRDRGYASYEEYEQAFRDLDDYRAAQGLDLADPEDMYYGDREPPYHTPRAQHTKDEDGAYAAHQEGVDKASHGAGYEPMALSMMRASLKNKTTPYTIDSDEFNQDFESEDTQDRAEGQRGKVSDNKLAQDHAQAVEGRGYSTLSSTPDSSAPKKDDDTLASAKLSSLGTKAEGAGADSLHGESASKYEPEAQEEQDSLEGQFSQDSHENKVKVASALDSPQDKTTKAKSKSRSKTKAHKESSDESQDTVQSTAQTEESESSAKPAKKRKRKEKVAFYQSMFNKAPVAVDLNSFSPDTMLEPSAADTTAPQDFPVQDEPQTEDEVETNVEPKVESTQPVETVDTLPEQDAVSRGDPMQSKAEANLTLTMESSDTPPLPKREGGYTSSFAAFAQRKREQQEPCDLSLWLDNTPQSIKKVAPLVGTLEFAQEEAVIEERYKQPAHAPRRTLRMDAKAKADLMRKRSGKVEQ